MFNLVSLILGGIALGATFITMLPSLAAFTWLGVPIAAMGLGFGLLSHRDKGRKLNAFVLAVCVVRLIMRSGWIG